LWRSAVRDSRRLEHPFFRSASISLQPRWRNSLAVGADRIYIERSGQETESSFRGRVAGRATYRARCGCRLAREHPEKVPCGNAQPDKFAEGTRLILHAPYESKQNSRASVHVLQANARDMGADGQHL
jgi:hypothetical protein